MEEFAQCPIWWKIWAGEPSEKPISRIPTLPSTEGG